jgi:uncharacterized membrane protein
MSTYLVLKWIHILSSTVLFGTGIGIAFFKWITDRTGDVRAIRIVSERTVLADWVFTTPAVVIQPVTGLAIAQTMGYSLRTPWILGSLLLYLVAGACWLPVVWLQLQTRPRPQGRRCWHGAVGTVPTTQCHLVLARRAGLLGAGRGLLVDGGQACALIKFEAAAPVIRGVDVRFSGTAESPKWVGSRPAAAFAATPAKRRDKANGEPRQKGSGPALAGDPQSAAVALGAAALRPAPVEPRIRLPLIDERVAPRRPVVDPKRVGRRRQSLAGGIRAEQSLPNIAPGTSS